MRGGGGGGLIQVRRYSELGEKGGGRVVEEEVSVQDVLTARTELRQVYICRNFVEAEKNICAFVSITSIWILFARGANNDIVRNIISIYNKYTK